METVEDVLARVKTFSGRELDITIGEALGYRWATLRAGTANLLHPALYAAHIAPHVPVLYQDGKQGLVDVEGVSGIGVWPALPRFSSDVGLAFGAVEELRFFEQGFSLTRKSNVWQMVQHLTGLPPILRAAHTSLPRVLGEMVAWWYLLPITGPSEI